MSHLSTLFPHLAGFRFISLHREPTAFFFTYERSTRTAACPACGIRSRRIHSRYARCLQDVPIQQRRVVLRLLVRKWFCDQSACPRRIFTERLPDLTIPWGRTTVRLRDLLCHLSVAHGGAAGTRSGQLFGVQVSRRTLLRRLHACPLPAVVPPTVIAIDDWAWKKRRRYGAIIVDLLRHRPIALLGDRSVDTVRQWLAAHPTITTVARDRSREFAAAISLALPQAQQAADRWHLAHNLTEQVTRVVVQRWHRLQHTWRQQHPAPPAFAREPQRTHAQQLGAERYARALELVQAGASLAQIAAQFHVSRRTVRRWLTEGAGPYGTPRSPYPQQHPWATAYLRERWEAGEHNGAVLYQEVQQRGYQGSLRSVFRRLAQWREHPFSPSRSQREPCPLPPASLLDECTPHQVVGWMLARPEDRDPADQLRLEAICALDATLAQTATLLHQWLAMIRDHTAEPLEAWLGAVRASAIPPLVAFARRIERDKAEVQTGLAVSYSTGPAEGHINKLKLIKRQAYGRASLAYLQRRLLLVA